MPTDDYAIKAYWWAERLPNGINVLGSWTLHIENIGIPIDLSMASISIISFDGAIYPLDLSNLGPSRIFTFGSRLDFQTLPRLSQWRVGCQAEIVCEIRGPRPRTIKSEIEWPQLKH